MKEIDFSKIDISDDFMFGYVMSDEARCKTFLEQILNIKIARVEYLEKQKTLDEKIDARSVRLDIYMEDGITIYNCEMQKSNDGNLPYRSRYYQGQIDINLISKGENYKNLKKTYIIFICSFDLFKKDRYLYTFENICLEDTEIRLGDNAIKVFVNTKGKVGNVTAEFKELMDYFNDSSVAETANNPLIKQLDDVVKSARSKEKWRHDYMTWKMYGDERFEAGMIEGEIKGKIEGKIESLKSIMKNIGCTLDDAMKILDIPEEEKEELRHLFQKR